MTDTRRQRGPQKRREAVLKALCAHPLVIDVIQDRLRRDGWDLSPNQIVPNLVLLRNAGFVESTMLAQGQAWSRT